MQSSSGKKEEEKKQTKWGQSAAGCPGRQEDSSQHWSRHIMMGAWPGGRGSGVERTGWIRVPFERTGKSCEWMGLGGGGRCEGVLGQN